jgi:peptide/nickel transport system permease protein
MLDFIARRLIAIVPVLCGGGGLRLPHAAADAGRSGGGDRRRQRHLRPDRRHPREARLNQPIWQQFGIWIGNILQGNFGESFFFKKTVAELIAQRIEPTVALATCTLIFASAVSVPIGVLAAYRQGSLFDRVVMAFSVMGFSCRASSSATA